ncbi:hypothetical protein [Prevotella ihumii]|uniref:hypothetical protein n=1 Tax=Prevotella ihumii TaxID=1917878 RepID=UPI00117C97E6|nr:hypothetical protein [Prevotella ihumii]
MAYSFFCALIGGKWCVEELNPNRSSDLSDQSDLSDVSDVSDVSDKSDWSDKSDDRFGLKS